MAAWSSRSGAPLDLYDRPANLFVAGFIGSPGMNFLEGHYVLEAVRPLSALPTGPPLQSNAQGFAH